ncbi:counting factor 60-like [Actinia tenebrosa]|uniref:Counting factor 60-like n=1 Tax=Actinia tenebrosa TaxID=6105 RepID=A0A6P8I8L1_ACTTE|nr:counting factor 60-like [Actinia tenebrosa]
MEDIKVLAALSLACLLSFASCLPEYCGRDADSDHEPNVVPKVAGFDLKQVSVVIRHGDRTRAGYSGPCWDNDEAVWDCLLTSSSLPAIKHDQHFQTIDRVYRKVYMEDHEPMQGDCALGVLTFKGYKQQELNGQTLRNLYVKSGFLKQNYSYTDIYVRSDDESRTMQSAQSLMLGMYPPSTIMSDRTHVLDINTRDQTFDNIEPNARLCPKLSEYNRDFLKSPEWQNHYNSVVKPLLEEVRKAIGVNRSLTMENLQDLVDCVHTHQCHGYEIPPGITDSLFQRMVNEVLYFWNSQYRYPSIQQFAKAGIGFLVNDMWQAMQKIMEGKGKKFLLYSGHDLTLGTLLMAFNISEGKWPPYASMFRLELYQNTAAAQQNSKQQESFAVKVIYNDQERKLPFCDASPCSMAQFEKYVNSIIPKDPETECKVSDPEVLRHPLKLLRHMMYEWM